MNGIEKFREFKLLRGLAFVLNAMPDSLAGIYKKGVFTKDGKVQFTVSYSHLHLVVRVFEEKGVVASEKVGRERVVRLTERGVILQKCLNAIIKMLGE